MKLFVVRVALASAFLWAADTGRASAEEPYPKRAISIMVPYSPGTGIDILGRLIAQKRSERWRSGVVVGNKPGASSNIGTELAARAAPDDHTLLMTATTFATNAALIVSDGVTARIG